MSRICNFWKCIAKRFKDCLSLKNKRKTLKTDDTATKTASQAINEIVVIYVESLRLLNLVHIILSGMDATKARRYTGRVAWYKEQLDASMNKLGLSVTCDTDIEYDAGMPVQIQNIGDFAEEDVLVIEKWIEPTIISQDGAILNQGIAIVRRK